MVLRMDRMAFWEFREEKDSPGFLAGGVMLNVFSGEGLDDIL